MRQQLGMAGIFVAGGMQRFLGERRGADRLCEAGLHDLDGLLDVAIGGVAGDRRHLAERQIVRHVLQIEALHGGGIKVRIFRLGQSIDVELHADH